MISDWVSSDPFSDCTFDMVPDPGNNDTNKYHAKWLICPNKMYRCSPNKMFYAKKVIWSLILNKTCIAKLFPVESESKSFGTVPDSAFISSSVFGSRGKIRICDTVNSIIPVVFRDLLGTVPGTGAILKAILKEQQDAGLHQLQDAYHPPGLLIEFWLHHVIKYIFKNFIWLFLGLQDLHWSVQSVWQTHERHPGRLWGVQVRFDNWWPMTGTPVCLYSNDDQLWMLHGRCGGSRFYLLCRIRIRSE